MKPDIEHDANEGRKEGDSPSGVTREQRERGRKEAIAEWSNERATRTRGAMGGFAALERLVST